MVVCEGLLIASGLLFRSALLLLGAVVLFVIALGIGWALSGTDVFNDIVVSLGGV